MLVINTTAGLARALDQPLDLDLKQLLSTRHDQLAEGGDLDGIARFAVVQPCDNLTAIEAALGFPIATNLIDGSRYPEPDFTPSWEHVRWHAGGWAEIVFILADDGTTEVLLVQDNDQACPELIQLLHDHAAPALEQLGPETA